MNGSSNKKLTSTPDAGAGFSDLAEASRGGAPSLGLEKGDAPSQELQEMNGGLAPSHENEKVLAGTRTKLLRIIYEKRSELMGSARRRRRRRLFLLLGMVAVLVLGGYWGAGKVWESLQLVYERYQVRASVESWIGQLSAESTEGARSATNIAQSTSTKVVVRKAEDSAKAMKKNMPRPKKQPRHKNIKPTEKSHTK